MRRDRELAALDPYRVSAGGQRHVVVELAWCTVRDGEHRGGELTHLMSERHGPLVRQERRAVAGRAARRSSSAAPRDSRSR